MKYLNHYLDYILFESVLLVSDDVSKILSGIKSKIGLQLWDYISTKSDIKTDYNTLGLSDKNDELFFLADARTQKVIADGDEPFGKNKQAMKIGRIARAILQKNGIKATDKEIEEFVNDYKSGFDILKTQGVQEEEQKIKLVEGEDIRHWYNIDNYTNSENLSGSELGKSCMRHSRCSEYFDIYVDNPEQCKLLIYLDDDNKLIGRALFWKLTRPSDCDYYLDRIYTLNSSDRKVMQAWLVDNIGDKKITFYDSVGIEHANIYSSRISHMEIKLKHGGDYDYYPYMDTFQGYSPYSGILTDSGGELQLTDTDGGNQNDNDIYCEYEGQSYSEDEVVYSDYHNVYMLRDNSVYSDHYNTALWAEDAVDIDGDYYHKDDAVYSEHLDTYLFREKAVEVFINEDETKSDWYSESDENEEFCIDTYTLSSSKKEKAYAMDLCVLDKNEEPIFKKWAIRTYASIDESKPEMYNDPCVTKLDSKIFKINIDKESKNWFDMRSYYQTKFLYASYNEWVSMVNDLPISDELLEKKLEQMRLVHEYLLENDKEYRLEYDVKSMGGIDSIVSKWEKLVDSHYGNITKDDMERSIIDIMSWKWEMFGHDYFSSGSDYEEAVDPTKRPLSELTDIFYKIYPIFLNLYKKYGYMTRYDDHSIDNNDFMLGALLSKIMEVTGLTREQILEQDYYISNRLRSVYMNIINGLDIDELDKLKRILSNLHSAKKLK